ncbi:hypothetical protein N0V83_002732 [Neocucurbitaria cava]|uniref:Carbonic anhydrase n=1 Tax=Neocucurbitaria cava TaxID=798079 RepID=A0A9W8YD84_9PLEO|nr:hypothetical protein N0V83_002732 [Neocucurbitaria cava]
MLLNALLLASSASATCLHGLSMFKRAEGETVALGQFGYGPLNGPFNWASLTAENEACKTGSNQSPINLDDSVTVLAEKPKIDIPAVEEAEFENLGTTIEVIANGTTSVAGSDFRLVQFHMHTPSEHHLNGEYHPLEVHMVHQGVGGIDFSDVLAAVSSSPILQYNGSLTTPPCAEGVNFMIVKDPLDISVADFNAIKSVVRFNARYIQNGLGQVNLLEVANLAGTASAVQPASVVDRPAGG